ncbi:ATP-binding protein [Nocardioides sp. SR21]|uniref:ATP-binding protein n=1 Tax=Nocardioides sp. SR21 TaxID=2919501 RepID=UPI001FA9784D|nr:ATP-binding protein [Nocardioides sp. SR21]
MSESSPGGLLTRTVAQLSTAQSMDRVTEIVATTVRQMLGAQGATFVLREDGHCFYADEDAIEPLWKGRRFPLESCVSGWAMLNKQPVAIPDIYHDVRVPLDAYRPTFVKSLCMAPIRTSDPVGALGAYWSEHHEPSIEEVRMLQVLANSTAVALENLELRSAITRRSDERDDLAARAQELESAIYTLVHDLRSPLGAMMGYAELIADDDLPEEKRRAFAETLVEAGGRMAEQIDQMLALYRVTNRDLEPAPVDITALARAVGSDLVVSQPERVIRVDVEDGMHAVADPTLARMVLENLIGNAVKYSGRKPESLVEVGLAEAGPALSTFFVRDNGAGFDAAETARLFRPMTRLHAETDFPGTGLGLASVARIVERHGGSVRAEGQRDVGATFYFSLPVT